MRAMRSIMPPPDDAGADDAGADDDELPLVVNRLPKKLPPDDVCADAVCVSATLPVAVRVVARAARSPLGGVRMLAGMVPAEVETCERTTPSSSTLCDRTAEANVGCMPPSAK